MAEIKTGLPDPASINQYGADPADVAAYQKSLEDSVKALEQRYAQPNWFNVAAGFLKPQLGGFGASLGSASQALGENIEKQRESALPIAQMRAQLAASKIAMGQGSSAAQKLAEWKASGKPMDEGTYAQITGLAPNSPAAAAAKAAYEGERNLQTQRAAQQSVLSSQYNADVTRWAALKGTMPSDVWNAGMVSLGEEYKKLRPPVVPQGTTENVAEPRKDNRVPPPVGSDTAGIAGSAGAVGAAEPLTPLKLIPGPSFKPANAYQLQIWQKELNKAYGEAAKGDTADNPDARKRAQADIKSIINEAGRVGAIPGVEPSKFDTSNFVIKPSFNKNDLIKSAQSEDEISHNKNIYKNAAMQESGLEAQYKNLQTVNEPIAFNTAKDANTYALNAIDTNPKLAVETTELLRKAGPIANLLAKGLGVSFGPYGAHISLDGLAPALVAGLNDTQKNYYDGLLNSVARSVYYDLKSRGIDPEKEGAEKFGQRMLQETHIDQGVSAIRHAIKENDLRLDHNANLYSVYRTELPKAVMAGSLSPLFDISTQHPEIKVHNGVFASKLKNESNEYLKNITKGKP
jgi:hypothetical protein